jgi:hypothetical protein
MNDCIAPLNASLETSRVNRAFLILAAMCVSLMPSVYKGGAEVPHAHSFFQFWLSGPESAFDHHHDGHAEADEDAHEHHHHQALETATADGHPITHVIARDVATISPVSAPGGVIDALGLVLLVVTLFALPVSIPWRFPRAVIRAREHRATVEPPPPRRRRGRNDDLIPVFTSMVRGACAP